jgi:hypothetical protein
MYNKIVAIIFSMLPLFAHSQRDSLNRFMIGKEVNRTLLIGASHQVSSSLTEQNRWFMEVGLHKTSLFHSRHGPAMYTYGASVLAGMDKNDKIIGFQVGACTSYFYLLGLNMTYYTNFKQGNFKITPELGVGLAGLKLAVGFNIPTFANKDFMALRHADTQFIFSYLVKIKTIKDEKRFLRY